MVATAVSHLASILYMLSGEGESVSLLIIAVIDKDKGPAAFP